MSLFRLFLKSRMTPGSVGALVVVQLGGVALAVVERFDVFPSADLSIFSAVAVPGFVVGLVLTVGISAVADLEAVARPRPALYALGAMLGLVAISLAVTEAARAGVTGTAYNGYDMWRNYFLFLGLGWIPALVGRWDVGPVLVTLTTVVALGLFGITRSMFPFAPLVVPAGRLLPALYAMAFALLVGVGVVLASSPPTRAPGSATV